jgi:ubiquinone/menaquinone biosynthesis C-methylase UbiE
MENLTKKQVEFGKWMRGFYDYKASKLYGNKYEYRRWFETPAKRRQFKFSTISLLYHLRDINFKNCLEVGCGPGTWTRLLLKKYPKARFTCLDISKEMIAQFKKQIKTTNVKTIVNNFLDEDLKNKKFDFLFCSRAIEYIPNKSRVIEKFYDLLLPGGKGLIVTSHPHPRTLMLKRMLGFKMNKQHMDRISVGNMSFLLHKAGFRNIKIYPILFSDFFLVPTSYLFWSRYKKRWGPLSKMFATGYVVKFEKPNE